MKRGLFITLEGLDGSGKTTQIKRLATWLEKHLPPAAATPARDAADGILPLSGSSAGLRTSRVVVTRQPGGTATGDQIRTLTLDSRSAALAPMTEMALMFADRAQAIAEVIKPALEAGKVVVCDRFTDSTEAYQGGGRQLGSQLVLDLHRLVCGNLQPDLTLLLLPSLESSLERARRRNDRTTARTGEDEGRFEQEKDAFFRRVWEKYHEIALREPQRVVSIEGNLSIDEVHEQIVEAVAERLITLETAPGK
jgi:dTMP kinase